MTIKRASNLALAALLLSAFFVHPVLAQGGDPFLQGVTWFIGGPARGIAMFAVAAAAVLVWFFMGSLRIAGFVLGGGLILANARTIVGWMGF
jgi:hypothetical protein